MATTNLDIFNSEKKVNGYYDCRREEMLSFIPKNSSKVLDVGCGSGEFGCLLKKQRTVEIWGIDPDQYSTKEAMLKYDRVFVGSFPDCSELPEHYFDCIVFNDVLEHMIEPWYALNKAKDFMRSGAYIVASIPNVRYLPLLYKLFIRGEWHYTPTGVLDKTHLRFFTKRSMLELFDQTGYEVLRIEGIYPYQRWQVSVLGLILPGFIRETKYIDYAILARPK